MKVPVYYIQIKFILNGVSIQTASVIVCLYLKRFPTTQEPGAGAEAGAGNAKYLVTLYSSIFLRAIFFLIFSPLVFDGFLAGFLLSFFFFVLLGHNNNLSSDLRSWQKSFQDNSFSGAASGKQAGRGWVRCVRGRGRGERRAAGLLAKYPLAFAKSVERKGPLVNTL